LIYSRTALAGFNDVGFHGSTQIPTPHMDEIAKTGVTLNNYHAQPVCSPTRASLMSGRHAIHHGIYMPFSQGSALRLNLSYTLLPAALKKLGYVRAPLFILCPSLGWARPDHRDSTRRCLESRLRRRRTWSANGRSPPTRRLRALLLTRSYRATA
jgi:hypothetical protein